MDVLNGVRIVELATGIAGPYAGKLFADAGADVVKVEPPDGDPMRRRTTDGRDLGGADAALFRHLNASKRSVIGAPEDAPVQELIAGADLIIESFVPSRIDAAALLARHPHLVVLSITPYGRSGPWADRPATGFTIQAESGSLGSRGRRDDPPFQAGGRVGEWSAGVFAAVGAFAALLRSRATGVGDHVDCPWLAADLLATNFNMSIRYNLNGRPPITAPARLIDAPSIEPTADGFLGLNTNTRQQLSDYLDLVGRSDLLAGDESWASADYRMLHVDEWNRQTGAWLRTQSTADALAATITRRIPAAPVNNGESLLDEEHYRVREIFGPLPDGDFLEPRPPYLLNGERPQRRGRAPRLGEHSGTIEAREVPRRADGVATGAPFAGLRVLDATAMIAGPIVGQVFAAFGADVIHLESIQRLDLGRLKVDRPGSSQWWERSQNWLMVGPNKRDLTLDLGDPDGRALVERLIAQCDVLVENYSPRVFDRFGLTAERVRELNPGIIFARMPAFGLDGPWRENVGFAQTMEQVSGMAWVTGPVNYPAPQVPRGPCDPLAGYHALFAIFAGLWKRDSTGSGSFLEVAMTESALSAAAELVVEYTAYGNVIGRNGNRSCDAAPQGLYQCRGGSEEWLALSVESDEQWVAAKAVFDPTGWASSSQFDTAAGRHAGHDELDEAISAWAAERDLAPTVQAFIEQGVPAASVTDPRLTFAHPQLAGWGFFEMVDHPVAGLQPIPALPFRFAGIDRWVRTPAPLLGQHNEEILCGLLGLSVEQLKDLERRGVIGTEPLGSNPTFNL